MVFIFGNGSNGYQNYEGYDDGYDEMCCTGAFCAGVQNGSGDGGEEGVSYGGVPKAKPTGFCRGDVALKRQNTAREKFKALADATPANFSGGIFIPHTNSNLGPVTPHFLPTRSG